MGESLLHTERAGNSTRPRQRPGVSGFISLIYSTSSVGGSCRRRPRSSLPTAEWLGVNVSSCIQNYFNFVYFIISPTSLHPSWLFLSGRVRSRNVRLAFGALHGPVWQKQRPRRPTQHGNMLGARKQLQRLQAPFPQDCLKIFLALVEKVCTYVIGKRSVINS